MNFVRPAEVGSALDKVFSPICFPPGPRRKLPLDLVNCTDSIIIRKEPLSDECHLPCGQVAGARLHPFTAGTRRRPRQHTAQAFANGPPRNLPSLGSKWTTDWPAQRPRSQFEPIAAALRSFRLFRGRISLR